MKIWGNMASKWHKYIDNIKDSSSRMAKEELKGLVASTKDDSDEFIRRQGVKMERYLNQLAGRKITKRQFEGYVIDIRDLTEMHALKMSVASKARAQRLTKGITDLIINGLLLFI